MQIKEGGAAATELACLGEARDLSVRMTSRVGLRRRVRPARRRERASVRSET